MEYQELLRETWVTGLSTIILAFTTIIYATLTFFIALSNHKMTKQVELQTQAFLRPVISINIIRRQGVILSLKISNTGNSPASNVTLNIDKNFFRFAEHKPDSNIKNYPAFKFPIPQLAVNDELIFDLCQGFNFDIEHEGEIITPKEFVITTSYLYLDKKYDETHHIDIKPYGTSLAYKNNTDHLENIATYLKSIAGNNNSSAL